MNIKSNFKKLLKKTSNSITLVIVSKKRSIPEILTVYKLGQRIFGENRVKELIEKFEKLPKNIEWHMIGHLQTNKVKYIAPFISLIHSVDSIGLLNEINKRAKQNNRIIDCLLQVHIAIEKSKFGFKLNEVEQALVNAERLDNIRIVGLMGMATHTNNKDQINKEFSSLRLLLHKIKNNNITILSIGMSGDYEIAIKNNSNMIRIGSALFCNRE